MWQAGSNLNLDLAERDPLTGLYLCPTQQHWTKLFGMSRTELFNKLLRMVVDYEGQELGVRRSLIEAWTLCFKYTEDQVTEEWESYAPFQKEHLEDMNEFEDSSWLYTCLGSFNFTGHEVFTTYNFLEQIDWHPKSLLDFHSVIGLHTLLLSKLYPKIPLVYFHPIARTYEFARDCLFPEFGVKAEIVTDIKKIPQAELVCSYEVFERDPNPTELMQSCFSTIQNWFSTSNCWTREARTHFMEYQIGDEIVPANKAARAYNRLIEQKFIRVARGWNQRPAIFANKEFLNA